MALSAENQEKVVRFLGEWEGQMYALAGKYINYIPGYEMEDLVQEMRLEIFLKYDGFDQSKGMIQTWATWVWSSRLSHLADYSTKRKKRSGVEVVEYGDNLDVFLLDDYLTADLVSRLDQISLSAEERGIITLLTRGAKLSDIRKSTSLTSKAWNKAIRNLQVAFSDLAPEGYQFSSAQKKRLNVVSEGQAAA